MLAGGSSGPGDSKRGQKQQTKDRKTEREAGRISSHARALGGAERVGSLSDVELICRSLERKKNKAETRQKTISKQMMDSSQALRQSKRNMQDAVGVVV